MKIEIENFAATLKALREKKGLTQREAAALIGSENQRAWTSYEYGDRTPSLAMAAKLLEAMGCTLCLEIKAK